MFAVISMALQSRYIELNMIVSCCENLYKFL
jgi:hypothetical protein